LRARRHLTFDRLDTRVVLDSGSDVVSAVGMVSGGYLGSTVLTPPPSNVIPLPTWYLDGCPTPTTTSASAIALPLDTLGD
jgi:hypothetical protein